MAFVVSAVGWTVLEPRENAAWVVGWLGGWAWGSSSSQGDAAAARSLHLPHHQQQAAGSRWAVGGGQPQPLPAFFVLRKLWHKANNNSPAVKVVHYLVVFVGLVKCQLTISLPRCLFNCHIETKSNGKDENDISQIIYQIWSGEGGIDIATQNTSKVQKIGIFFVKIQNWGAAGDCEKVWTKSSCMVNVRHVQ